jgi:glutamate-1-semialdehyde 2,1-aminomutase
MNIKESYRQSTALSLQASKYIAGGVVSLNRKVNPHIVFSQGKGSKIYDLEGNEYIDYHAAFGPHMLGHNNEEVNDAVREVLSSDRSLIGSGTNPLEVHLAQLLCQTIESLDLVQITNTGSEAVAHAIRLSRAFTQKTDVLLVLGGYNGWHNEVCRSVMPQLHEVGARVIGGEYPFIPLSAGIPEVVQKQIHVVNFNDLESVEFVLKRYPVACVLTEPVLQNIGVVLPRPGYLQGLLDLCDRYGTLCIFDEVKTGFRSAIGGYQHLAGVKPHLSTFGKAVANGYPLGIIGGRKDIMEFFDHPDPTKRVFMAGTYNAHPVSTAAAIATLHVLQNPQVYQQIADMSCKLYQGIEALFEEKGIPFTLSRNASAFCVYFAEKEPKDLHDIIEHVNFTLDLRYRKMLIERGVYHIPIPCKQGSVSYAHSEKDIEKTLQATREVLKQL